MTFLEVMKELESLGTEQTRKIYRNHGADIDQFGVSIANLKKIAKKLKDQHDIGMELLHSGNIDAMYLSQFVLNPLYVEKEDLEEIIELTDYYMILDNLVSPIIARNPNLVEETLYEYLESENHRKRQVAYNTYSLLLGSLDNDLIDFNHVTMLMKRVKETIHSEQNRVRYSMNNFLIAAGASNPELTDFSKEIAKEIGKVEVYMGKTSCKVPDAYSYIEKIESKGYIGKKRKLK